MTFSPVQPTPGETLVLGRDEVAALMRPADYLTAMDAAFRAGHAGRAVSATPMHLAGWGGAFHAKCAVFDSDRRYAVLKFNGNFPGNRERNALPTIQGVIVLSDAETGSVLAVIDSIEVTLRRTAAATALAARLLARPDSTALLVCGCGEQARAHVEALAGVLPIERVRAWDIDGERARAFASAIAIECEAVTDLTAAARASDVIVTCTTARAPFLRSRDCADGTFVAAVGADNPEKSEIFPELFARATVVVDDLGQCRAMGDLRHAIAAGAVSGSAVFATLGEIVTGAKPGRRSADEIVLFDSTGTAIQDAVSAAFIFERALAGGTCTG